MSLLIRREVDETRSSTVFELGELVYSTDGRKLYVGDGITRGGVNVIETCAGAGLSFDPYYQTLNAEPSEGSHIPTLEDQDGKFLTNVDGALRWEDIKQVPDTAGFAGKFLGINGTELAWKSVTLPYLTENLSLNNFDIIGPGNIAIGGTISNGEIALSGSSIVVGDIYLNLRRRNDSTLIIKHDVPNPAEHYIIKSVTDGVATCGTRTYTCRGSLAGPEAVHLGDNVSFTNTQYAHDGSSYVISSAISHTIDLTGEIGNGKVPGRVMIGTFNDGNDFNVHGVAIDHKGWTSVNKMYSAADATLDINGFAKLQPLTEPPVNVKEGTIAVADKTNWNPANKETGRSYPVYFDGENWIPFF